LEKQADTRDTDSSGDVFAYVPAAQGRYVARHGSSAVSLDRGSLGDLRSAFREAEVGVPRILQAERTSNRTDRRLPLSLFRPKRYPDSHEQLLVHLDAFLLAIAQIVVNEPEAVQRVEEVVVVVEELNGAVEKEESLHAVGIVGDQGVSRTRTLLVLARDNITVLLPKPEELAQKQ
jgi:hypothetical protein